MASENERLKRSEITVRKRVECEENAFHIVNKLIDGCVDGSYLSECGRRISQGHYDDIVEERAITKLCGYPLCDQSLPNVPKKKYHISTKSNKVYDISERKNFCSNQCYKASTSFKQQIPESPVWSKERETNNIVISPHKEVPGLVGDEVIGVIPKEYMVKELEKLEELDKRCGDRSTENDEVSLQKGSVDEKKPVTVVSEGVDPEDRMRTRKLDKGNNDTIAATGFVEDIESNISKLNINLSDKGHISPIDSSVSYVENSGNHKPVCDSRNPVMNTQQSDGDTRPQSLSKMEQLQKLLSKRKNVLSGMVDLQETSESNTSTKDTQQQQQRQQQQQQQKTETKPKISDRMAQKSERIRNIPKKSANKKDAPSTAVVSPLDAICQVLKKWVTIGTVDYLQFNSVNAKPVDNSVTQSFSQLEIDVGSRDLEETLKDQEKELDSFLGEGTSRQSGCEGHGNDLKNVPDYKKLQEESDQFQLRVTEFMTGKRPKDTSKEKKDDTSDDNVYIPTVDTYDHSQIRAKIVLEKLDKSLPDLLTPMRLSVQDVSTHIRELVYTFRLERDNIIFKPAEWTVVSLFLLKMLSFKVKIVDAAFAKDSTVRHLAVMLTVLKHTVQDLDVLTKDILTEAVVIHQPTSS